MENTENRLPQEEQEIDLLELAKKLWKRKKLFIRHWGGADCGVSNSFQYT